MLTNNDLHHAILELVEEVEQVLTHRIEEYGYNERAEKNTLQGSELEKSIKVYPKEYGIALEIANYWEYVALGWKHTRKSNERGLYHALVLWALRKHIMLEGYTQNESAVILAEKVWMNMIFNDREIAPRPFMEYDKSGKGDLEVMIPELKEYMEKWFDALFNKIMEDIDNFFKE